MRRKGVSAEPKLKNQTTLCGVRRWWLVGYWVAPNQSGGDWWLVGDWTIIGFCVLCHHITHTLHPAFMLLLCRELMGIVDGELTFKKNQIQTQPKFLAPILNTKCIHPGYLPAPGRRAAMNLMQPSHRQPGNHWERNNHRQHGMNITGWFPRDCQ